MLTKAYIQEVISPNSVRVRMPLYNKIENVNGATPNNELHVACVCTLPGFVTDTKPGDIVIVGFEEGNLSNPVILGYLSVYTDTPSLVDVTCNDLTVKGDTLLGEYTHIGDVTPFSIKCLERLKVNAQDTFDGIDIKLSDIYSKIETTNTNLAQVRKDFEEADDDINSAIDGLAGRVDRLEKDVSDLKNALQNYLNRHTPVFGETAYGTKLPANSQAGQMYLTLKDEIK